VIVPATARGCPGPADPAVRTAGQSARPPAACPAGR